MAANLSLQPNSLKPAQKRLKTVHQLVLTFTRSFPSAKLSKNCPEKIKNCTSISSNVYKILLDTPNYIMIFFFSEATLCITFSVCLSVRLRENVIFSAFIYDLELKFSWRFPWHTGVATKDPSLYKTYSTKDLHLQMTYTYKRADFLKQG